MTRAAFAAGAPEVFDEVTIDGRFGIVLRRLDGPTLQQLLLTRAMTPEQVGAILASLYISVHKTPPLLDVPSLHRWIDFASQASRDILPQHIATGVLTLIDRLPPGGWAVSFRSPPWKRDHDGGWSANHRLGLCASRIWRLRHRPCPRQPFRARPGRRRSGVAARNQCHHAVRIRAAVWPVPCGVDGGGAAISADPSRVRPSPAAASHPCPAEAADPARRSNLAFGPLLTSRTTVGLPAVGGRRSTGSS